WTFRLSPEAKSGTSSRSEARSTRSVLCMAGSSWDPGARRPRAPRRSAIVSRLAAIGQVEADRAETARLLGLRELLHQRPVLSGQRAVLEQVGTTIGRAVQRLGPPPAGQLRVVTRPH